jgi:arylformamidase
MNSRARFPLLALCFVLVGSVRGADTPALRDVAYGDDPAQKMDVYRPVDAHAAAVILMVHGGAWRVGDKDSSRVVDHKMNHWLHDGFVFISVNYRMLPKADPLVQASDVARALAYAQRHASEWGADPAKFILMGHSAGAHLVSVLATNAQIAKQAGAQPWLGTVSLDSAALNVPEIMQRRHLGFYDAAFGKDPSFWRTLSPIDQLTTGARPMLDVCSSVRMDHPCDQAHAFAQKAQSLGVRAQVLEQPLKHSEINDELGKPGAYTDAVDRFLGSLDESVAERLRE